MKMLRLSDIIGQEIVDYRYHYSSENEWGLQSFQSFLKLGNGQIIDIPQFDDDEYIILNPENLKYLQEQFDTGEIARDTALKLFIGQKITDLIFRYYNDKIMFDECCYIQLSNGNYMTEKQYGPPGLFIDLRIYNEKEFSEHIERFKAPDTDFRSFLTKKSVY